MKNMRVEVSLENGMRFEVDCESFECVIDEQTGEMDSCTINGTLNNKKVNLVFKEIDYWNIGLLRN